MPGEPCRFLFSSKPRKWESLPIHFQVEDYPNEGDKTYMPPTKALSEEDMESIRRFIEDMESEVLMKKLSRRNLLKGSLASLALSAAIDSFLRSYFFPVVMPSLALLVPEISSMLVFNLLVAYMFYHLHWGNLPLENSGANTFSGFTNREKETFMNTPGTKTFYSLIKAKMLH